MFNLLPPCARIVLAAMVFTGPVCAQPSSPADDGQWTMPAKNFENTRYSGLDQIKIDNATNLLSIVPR